MKTIKLIPLVALMFSFSSLMAQHHGGDHEDKLEEKKEKVDAARIAFITNELDLTTEEAQKFWPIHNEFRAEMDKLHEERRAIYKKEKGNIDDLSDEEVKGMMDKHFALERQELALKEKYHKKFLEVLPAKKVAKLYHAEQRFKRELLQRMKGRDGDKKDSKGEGRRGRRR